MMCNQVTAVYEILLRAVEPKSAAVGYGDRNTFCFTKDKIRWEKKTMPKRQIAKDFVSRRSTALNFDVSRLR